MDQACEVTFRPIRIAKDVTFNTAMGLDLFGEEGGVLLGCFNKFVFIFDGGI